LQAVGEKGNQNVSVGPMLQLMVDGAYAEFTLERSEDRFEVVYQLHPKRAVSRNVSE
jgi:hypothetical protein